MTWKFTDQTNTSICRTNANGSSEVMFASALPAGEAILPADVSSPNVAVLAQLTTLESNPAVCRTVREHMIANDQTLAQILATINPTGGTAAQLLAANAGHQRIKAVDDQAHALRAQLK